jgi:hypothetical protein
MSFDEGVRLLTNFLAALGVMMILGAIPLQIAVPADKISPTAVSMMVMGIAAILISVLWGDAAEKRIAIAKKATDGQEAETAHCKRTSEDSRLW